MLLPPIAYKPLYYPKPIGGVALQGFYAYQEFRTVVILKLNQHANGESEESFRTLFIDLRNGEPSKDVWKLLLPRDSHLFSPQQLQNFQIRLTFRNKSLFAYNITELHKLGKSII